MHDTESYVASPIEGRRRPSPRRVPMGDERGVSVNPQLVIIAASLALWTVIIAACTIVFL